MTRGVTGSVCYLRVGARLELQHRGVRLPDQVRVARLVVVVHRDLQHANPALQHVLLGDNREHVSLQPRVTSATCHFSHVSLQPGD